MLRSSKFSKFQITRIFSQGFTQHGRCLGFTLSSNDLLLTFLNCFINNKGSSLSLLLGDLFRLNCG